MALTLPFKVSCESCQLQIVIADPQFIGKQISCRRCKTRFRIPSPDDTQVDGMAPMHGIGAPAHPETGGFAPYKVKCALCELAFVVTDPAFIGKKIKCRQCQYLFRIPEPEGYVPAVKPEPIPKPAAPPAESKAPSIPSLPALPPEQPVPAPAAPGEEPNTPDDEVAVDASDSPGKKRRKKKKARQSKSKVTRVGLGIGAVALALIVGGYFAFFGGDKNPSNTKTNLPPTQPGNNDANAAKKNPAADPKIVAKIPGKDDVGNTTPPKDEDLPPPPKTGWLADGRHITNLLPEDSEWVLSMTKEVNKTPVYKVLFEPTGAGKVFQKWMGFKGNDVDELVMSGGLKSCWVFAVVRLAKPVALPDLQGAMQLAPKQTILNRDYYQIVSNDLLKVLADYFGEEIKALGLEIPLVDAAETMSLYLLDPHTLVIAHTTAMQKFLTADTRRSEQTLYIPNSPAPPPKDPKEAAVPGKKAPAGEVAPSLPGKKDAPETKPKTEAAKPPAEKANPVPDAAKPLKEDEARGLTTDPTYLTIDSSLKIMMNQLELEKRPMISFAVKIDKPERVGAAVISAASDLVEKIPEAMKLKAPVIGLRMSNFDNRKMSISAGIHMDTIEQVKFWLEPLNFQLPSIAEYLTNLIGPKIVVKKPDPAKLESKVKDPFLNAGNQLGSFLWTATQDKMMSASIHVDWSLDYDSVINPNLRYQVDLIRGKALMSTGHAYWASNAQAIKKMQDTNRLLPPAAFPRKSDASRFNLPYPPQERVSWMVDLLPYLGYDAVSDRIDKELAWNDDKNLRGGRAWIPEFLNPSYPPQSRRAVIRSMDWMDFGATDFVGLSGIGLDAAHLPDTPENAKKLGLFGYERRTSYREIVAGDGASNTIFMIQAPPNIPRPWIRGGGATVNGVPLKNSIKPFVTPQPDGKKGAIVLMADGSIRFISENISDEVFQALVTYKGGDQVGNIDQIAPTINPAATEPKPAAQPMAHFPADGVEWPEVAVSEIGGMIRMPGPPEISRTPEEVTYAWPKQQNITSLLTLTISSPPGKLEGDSSTETELDRLIDELDKKGLKPKNRVKVMIGDRPGRQYQISTSRGELNQQMFIARSKLVIMEAAGSGSVSGENVRKYFDSIQLGGVGVKPVDPKIENPKEKEQLPAPRVK